jgi:hypothetical protein
MVRLSGNRHTGGGHEVGIDYSGCLLQRITRKGETGLHEAIKTGNFELARVLCGARGGSTSVVLGMDFRGSTPWGVAIAKYCIRDRLKSESSVEEYKALDKQLDFQGCLDGVQCGVFPFIAMYRADDGTFGAIPFLDMLLIHAEKIGNNQIFATRVSDALVNEHMWSLYARQSFSVLAVLHILAVVTFTLAATSAHSACVSARLSSQQSSSHADDDINSVSIIETVDYRTAVPALLLLRLVLIEVMEMRINGFGYYIASITGWNGLQLGSAVLGLASLVVHSFGDCDTDWTSLHAAASGSLWFATMYFLPVFDQFQPVVPM